jgi:hypothetical protein
MTPETELKFLYLANKIVSETTATAEQAYGQLARLRSIATEALMAFEREEEREEERDDEIR